VYRQKIKDEREQGAENEPEREEITESLRKLHNGERANLYSSPDIIRVIKPRWM
jgi:hypothetical protein